jgi:hypothetical protein
VRFYPHEVRSSALRGLLARRRSCLPTGKKKQPASRAEHLDSHLGQVIADRRRNRERVKKHDILLIAEEVICGFGRTGAVFGCETFGIEPDMIAMAKQLSAVCQPISAVGLWLLLGSGPLVWSIQFGFSWRAAVSLPRPPLMRLGFSWISLDSLVRIEPFQRVTRLVAGEIFLAPFSAARDRRNRDAAVLARGSAGLFIGQV